MLPLLLSGEKGEVTISGWFDLKYQQQQQKKAKTKQNKKKKTIISNSCFISSHCNYKNCFHFLNATLVNIS